jgi:hypothetical protein
MDPTSLILPGAQSLVTQILSDGWAQARAWLVRRLTRPDSTPQPELERRLDVAHAHADILAAPDKDAPVVTDTPRRRALLEAYWAGYLAAMLGEHPEFAEVLAELATPAVGCPAPNRTVNSVTGRVSGNVVQAGTIEGGVRFG